MVAEKRIADDFLQQFWRQHPIKKAKKWSGKWKERGTRNVQGCNMAKTKTQQMCRSQGIDGQLVGLEHSRGSSLAWTFGQALLKSWIGLWNPESIQTGKQTLPRFQPTTFYRSIYATQRPTQLVRIIRSFLKSPTWHVLQIDHRCWLWLS